MRGSTTERRRFGGPPRPRGRRKAIAALVLAAAAPSVASAQPLDRPLRAVHASGNWGENPRAVRGWEEDRTRPLVPSDHIEFLRDVHADWVGVSVALHIEGSTDSTVERAYSGVAVPTFTDDALRQMVREFRTHGFNVYLTLAIESFENVDPPAGTPGRPLKRWQLGDPGDPATGVPPDHENCPSCAWPIAPESWPWRPSHPDHKRFVGEFWRTYAEQAVHFARIAQEEGVRMYSLGTETDRLFRTRPGDDYWRNDFRRELGTLVDGVHAVYDGVLTYDRHYSTFEDDGRAPGSRFLWEDLDLDVIGVSAWFPLADEPPTAVMNVDSLRREYERILGDYLLPAAAWNPGRPIVTVSPVAEGVAAVTVTAAGSGVPGPTLQFTVAVRPDPQADRRALEALYRATGGDAWTNNDNWLKDAPLRDWHGVETNEHGRVTGLRLGGWDETAQAFVGNGLTGSLPPELGELSRLRSLEIGGNSGLTGPIPAEVGNLAHLESLFLQQNWLTGSIPAALGRLRNLDAVGLDGNALSGTIPAELGNLTGLRLLTLTGNALSGTVPSALGDLTGLTDLGLGWTMLSGPCPQA